MNIESIKRRVDKLSGPKEKYSQLISIYLVGFNADGTRTKPILYFSNKYLIAKSNKNNQTV